VGQQSLPWWLSTPVNIWQQSHEYSHNSVLQSLWPGPAKLPTPRLWCSTVMPMHSAHTLVNLPGLAVQTPVLKPHPVMLICLDPYRLPRSHSALLTPLDPSVALPPTSPQALLMSTHPYHNTLQGGWHVLFCTLTPLLWLLNILHRGPTHHSWHTETPALTALTRIMAMTCSHPCLAFRCESWLVLVVYVRLCYELST
jgi:hypothetical protein